MESGTESISPQVDEKEAEKILQDFYDLKVEKIKQIDGYEDLNFHFICKVSKNCEINIFKY